MTRADIVKRATAHVYTYRNDILGGGFRLYVLFKSFNRWRIDNVKYRLTEADRWKPSLLGM